MAHRKWKETKQLPGTARPGNMLGSCLVSFHFLWAILCPQAVHTGLKGSETAFGTGKMIDRIGDFIFLVLVAHARACET